MICVLHQRGLAARLAGTEAALLERIGEAFFDALDLYARDGLLPPRAPI